MLDSFFDNGIYSSRDRDIFIFNSQDFSVKLVADMMFLLEWVEKGRHVSFF